MSKGTRALIAGVLICIFAWITSDSLLFPWYVKLAIGIGFIVYGTVLMYKKK